MSMQINLQHVFKMSASRTHACIRTSLAYIHVRRSARPSWYPSKFQNLAGHSFFCRAWDENKRCFMLLMHTLLSVIRQISGNEFVFQQVTAPAHRARETMSSYVERRRTLFHRNSGHRTVQILTRWITKSGLQCSSASTRQRFELLTNCDSVCWTFGAALNKTSWTHPLTSGVCDSKRACVR